MELGIRCRIEGAIRLLLGLRSMSEHRKLTTCLGLVVGYSTLAETRTYDIFRVWGGGLCVGGALHREYLGGWGRGWGLRGQGPVAGVEELGFILRLTPQPLGQELSQARGA